MTRRPTLGVFSRTYARMPLEDVFGAIARDAYRGVHFNFSGVGLATLPPKLDHTICEQIRTTAAKFGLTIVGVSATYNAIHPDTDRRRAETKLAQRVIELAPLLGANLVSICTGTRDTNDIWSPHPENAGMCAWEDLLATLELLLRSARNAGVTLGIEPERANVVSSAQLAHEVLMTAGPGNLGVILDVANLLAADEQHRQSAVIRDAVDLLAPWVVVLHAKDRDDFGERPPGDGWIDLELCLSLMAAQSFSGPVVIHGISQGDSARAREYMSTVIDRHFTPSLKAPECSSS